MRSNLLLRVVLSLSLSGAAALAQAATFCVGNAADLQDALTTAASNGEDDTVKVRSGTYVGPGVSVGWAYSTLESKDLVLRGGYSSLAMFPCIFDFGGPGDTELSGSDARPVISLGGGSGTTGAITVENLTIRDGNAPSDGGGLNIGRTGGFAGDVLVDRVQLLSNVAGTFGAGAYIASKGIVTIRNNWIRNNTCGDDRTCAAEVIVADDGNGTVPRAFIGNNTVTGNSCLVPLTCGNAGLYVGGSAIFAIYNNAFYNNGGSDIRLQADNILFNNFYQVQDGISPGKGSQDNINPANPGFVNPGLGNFRLLPTSPLVNAGTGGYLTGSLDFDGNPRLNGYQYDIGAFENDNTVFQDSFEAIF